MTAQGRHTDEELANGLEVEEVDAPTMQLIMDFLKQHETVPFRPIPKPIRKPWTEEVRGWDKSWVMETLTNKNDRNDNEKLFNVLNAATALQLEHLAHLTGTYVAHLMVGLTVTELRALLHVQEADLHSPEFEQEMSAEFKKLFPEHARIFELPPRAQ